MRKAVALLVIALASGPSALAQQAKPTVNGSVTGALEQGSQVRMRVAASHPDGWQKLKEIAIRLELHGVVLEALDYEVVDHTLETGGSSVLAGTGGTARGKFFSVPGFGLNVTTGGKNLRLVFQATLVEKIPPDARFRFVALDYDEQQVSTALAAAVEGDGGIGIATVVLAVIAALVAGGFVGGQIAVNRGRRSSIYTRIAREIEREKKAKIPEKDLRPR